MTESQTAPLEWVSALSTRASLEAAVDEVIQRAIAPLSGPPDLALIFISAAYASEYPRLMPLLREKLAAALGIEDRAADGPSEGPSLPVMVGCGGGGIIGQDSAGRTVELEEDAALSLTLARLPGATAIPFHIDAADLPDLDSSPSAWAELTGVPMERRPHFILLADPALTQINDLLQGLDYAYPGAVKVGGLASGSSPRDSRCLFLHDRLHRAGTVGVALCGEIEIEAIVAQGCRPIGPPFWVVESEQNILMQIAAQTPGAIAGREEAQSPLEALRETIQTLSDSERELAQHSLFVGVARDEFRQTLKPGDFLIRNLIGVDPKAGAIAVGDRIRPGQRIQFHLRDAKTSAQDLETLLQSYRDQHHDHPSPVGALMFTCLGRGEGLYEEPNFDSGLVNQFLPGVPVSGFFCNGEIGPVGGNTFIHGYTSVFGLCRRPVPPREADRPADRLDADRPDSAAP